MACNAPAQRTASALFCAPARSWQRVLHAPYSSPPQALDACPRCASNWLRVELQPTPFSRPCYCSYMFEMNRDKETTPAIDVSPAAMKQLKARAPVPSKAEKEEKELDWLAPWTAHQEAGEACRQRLLAMPREAWPPRDRPQTDPKMSRTGMPIAPTQGAFFKSSRHCFPARPHQRGSAYTRAATRWNWLSTAATPYDKRARNVAARPSDGRGAGAVVHRCTDSAVNVIELCTQYRDRT